MCPQIVSLWTQVVMEEAVDWVDFQEYKIPGTGQEAILKLPRKLIFQSWNQIFVQVPQPKQSQILEQYPIGQGWANPPSR